MDFLGLASGQDFGPAYLNKIRRDIIKADLRKGEKPQMHPSGSTLAKEFQFDTDYPLIPSLQDRVWLDITLALPHHHPCIRPEDELKPLMISSMALETRHRGARTLLRILTRPASYGMVMVSVEDEEGTGALLQIYNQPEKAKDGKDPLRVGDVCIIKEPLFKQFVAGFDSYTLRVDHISDIIWLHNSDSRIPMKWRQGVESLQETSQDIRARGNAAVQNRKWAEAERLYTKAILAAKTPEEEQLAHLNRSLCNLRLDRAEKALDDASKGHPTEAPPREKALFREAKALYSLQKFDSCLEKLVILVRSNPKNPDAWAEIKRVQQRLREQKKGSYEFRDMYKQAEAVPPLVDCATYVGSVGVCDSPGRGKGLFTTKPVKAGELLLCEKAFAYSYSNCESDTKFLVNEDCSGFHLGGRAELFTKIIQKIYHNHIGSETFINLDHGNYAPVAVSEVGGVPVVDTFLVNKICQINGFDAPRGSVEDQVKAGEKLMKGQPADIDVSYGLWLLAARINHSCVYNCVRSLIGDMLIVRASADMEADTELCFDYRNPQAYENYRDVQKALMSCWGFTCNCALCLDKKSTSPHIFQKREDLRDRFDDVLSPTASMAKLMQAKRIIDVLEQTWTVKRDAQPLPRIELSDPYYQLGETLRKSGKIIDGLKMFVKGLQADGFAIETTYPGVAADGKTKKKAALEIKRWGATDKRTADMFLRMIVAWNALAPEVGNTIKEYMKISYRIAHGENETLLNPMK